MSDYSTLSKFTALLVSAYIGLYAPTAVEAKTLTSNYRNAAQRVVSPAFTQSNSYLETAITEINSLIGIQANINKSLGKAGNFKERDRIRDKYQGELNKYSGTLKKKCNGFLNELLKHVPQAEQISKPVTENKNTGLTYDQVIAANNDFRDSYSASQDTLDDVLTKTEKLDDRGRKITQRIKKRLRDDNPVDDAYNSEVLHQIKEKGEARKDKVGVSPVELRFKPGLGKEKKPEDIKELTEKLHGADQNSVYKGRYEVIDTQTGAPISDETISELAGFRDIYNKTLKNLTQEDIDFLNSKTSKDQTIDDLYDQCGSYQIVERIKSTFETYGIEKRITDYEEAVKRGSEVEISIRETFLRNYLTGALQRISESLKGYTDSYLDEFHAKEDEFNAKDIVGSLPEKVTVKDYGAILQALNQIADNVRDVTQRRAMRGLVKLVESMALSKIFGGSESSSGSTRASKSAADGGLNEVTSGSAFH